MLKMGASTIRTMGGEGANAVLALAVRCLNAPSLTRLHASAPLYCLRVKSTTRLSPRRVSHAHGLHEARALRNDVS